MSAIVYDEAVKHKIKTLFPNTEFQERDFSFKTVTDRLGEVKFPYISIFRPDGWSIGDGNTWIENREYLNKIRQVYIDLSYQIDIYANTREDLEGLTTELVLYLLRNPGIKVHYGSVDGTIAIDVRTSLQYVSGPERTSELSDTAGGRIYRYTLVFALENAVIYSFVSEEEYDKTLITSLDINVETIEVTVDAYNRSGVTSYTDKEVHYGKNKY